MKKQWKIKSVDEQAVQLLSEQSGLSPLLSKLLVLRGIREVNQCNHYLAPNPAHFHDPFLFQDMKTAVLRVMKAIETEERVLIHGDYDVDGIASTCLLLEVLQELGLQPNFFIPNRLSEGYGIQVENIAEFAKEYDLLITVDCGINSWEAVELANQNGLDVIITDHHEPGAVKPNAIAVINPMCKDETYPFKYLCGAGVVWKFAAALRIHAGLSDELLDQIELAALGTVADVVPLQGENRTLVSLALQRFATCFRPGLTALMDVAKVSAHHIDTEALAFRIAPRLNAAGRMGEAQSALLLLYSQDEDESAELAQKLNQLNQQRQAIEKKVLEEAIQCIEQDHRNERSRHILVVIGNDWHLGVLGIVAARLQSRYGKSTFVLSLEEGVAHGSARALDGVDLVPILDGVREHTLSCGGHASAAGVRVEEIHLPSFEQALYQAAERVCAGMAEPALLIDAQVPLEQIDHSLMNELLRLQPYGEGNEEPIFAARSRMNGYGARIVGNGHLRLSLQHPRGAMDAIGFNMAPVLESLGDGELELVFRCRYNEFQGRKSINLHLLAIRPSTPSSPSTAAMPPRQPLASAPKPVAPAGKPVPSVRKLEPYTPKTPGNPAVTLDRKTLGTIYRLLQKSKSEDNTLNYKNVFLFSKLTKTTNEQFKTALQVFVELGFLKISGEKITMLEVENKRDLTESPTFRLVMQR
jgi:single-stranded-DNA-specific exonuclease